MSDNCGEDLTVSAKVIKMELEEDETSKEAVRDHDGIIVKDEYSNVQGTVEVEGEGVVKVECVSAIELEGEKASKDAVQDLDDANDIIINKEEYSNIQGVEEVEDEGVVKVDCSNAKERQELEGKITVWVEAVHSGVSTHRCQICYKQHMGMGAVTGDTTVDTSAIHSATNPTLQLT